MKHLKTIRDADFGITDAFPAEFKDRSAVRAVVFDAEGNIALIHASKRGYHKLPGGGIDEGEDMMEALARELVEEIGCAAKDFRGVGSVEEFRAGHALHHVSYCFIARLSGEKGESQLMEDEAERGFETEWVTLDSAIQTLEREISNIDTMEYAAKFMVTRDLCFLKAAAALIS